MINQNIFFIEFLEIKPAIESADFNIFEEVSV